MSLEWHSRGRRFDSAWLHQVSRKGIERSDGATNAEHPRTRYCAGRSDLLRTYGMKPVNSKLRTLRRRHSPLSRFRPLSIGGATFCKMVEAERLQLYATVKAVLIGRRCNFGNLRLRSYL